MYADAFGFDWKRLSEEEALKRMYALGVAAVLGDRQPEEYRRILAQASTAYRRSVLELSFKEGQQRAKNNRQEFDAVEEVWDALVDPEATGGGPPSARAKRRQEQKQGMPEAVSRARMLEFDFDDLERIRLPELLRRD